MGLLDGRAVVITGAGRGLGRAYALHAAERGAAVLVNDVDVETAHAVVAEIRAAGGTAAADGGSVARAVDAAALIDRCVAYFGSIDGLVNNAAVNYQAPAWELEPDLMRELIEINVLGPLYCGAAAIAAMREQGGGRIVNIVSGSMLGQRGAAAYSASKGALASLTFSWAADLAEHGIRVNGVAPLAYTRMVRSEAARRACPPELTPDQVAPVVTYLLSELSGALTGQIIRFVGGRLHLLRQPGVKEPVLARDEWAVHHVAEAFTGPLAAATEPPPAARWRL
ncbi:NAD(P)-dependent dehydrogenase (short-subunit alcohol dehydrogenase family) [Actinoalloteichus hoggarensis]|uniref:Putative short-chain type dehydrogenase/reductase n=1 Tax=Actinoalloteichus hoggarensis TaxID=1470176 RepID=A0A221W580_9PSEU|nr:SDR family oxidoreductase [Actinoalloteichus hoggarensis]ASO20874.1 Putative short-chain type dehydrogenase/reductase [Actinoalloteichus hoggarensis]MBB5920805.1 NAD(P)-dependent dehydrogenase (short-subunit alcohol dehydrogenase family) [Actinoalloteichus hoggarensis]